MQPVLKKIAHLPFPLISLLLCVLSFGLLIPWLGFYWDDWASIAALRQFGASGIWELMGAPFRHRPLSGWTFIFFSPLAGTSPVGWQIVALGVRWAAVCALWGLLRELWPGKRWQTAAIALLFTVYPIFRQQPIAVTYHQHWTSYALFLASLWLMARAIHSSRRFWLFTGLAITAQALHLAVFEYFIGAELARGVVIWLLLRDMRPWMKRAMRTLVQWLPYAVLLAGFIGWRMSISLADSGDGNRPGLLFTLLHEPLQAIQGLLSLAGEDLQYFLFTSWMDSLAIRNLPAILVALLAAALIIWALKPASHPIANLREFETNKPATNFWPEALLLGSAALLVGTLPIWLTGSQATGGIFANRFGLPAMWGAAILWVVALEALLRRRSLVIAVLAVMVGLAAGLHLQTAQQYRSAWSQQQDYYWQLYWRAPSIQPDTAILSADDIFPYTRRTFATNLLYQQPSVNKTLPLWFYHLDDRMQKDTQNFSEWQDQDQEYLEYTFRSNSANNLVLLYPPAADANCLWLLDARNVGTPRLPEAVSHALPLSNPARVLSSAQAAPPKDAFGAEPEPGWCYTFQKAELAAQYQDWDTVVNLGDAARASGYTPLNPLSDSAHEWLVFLQAYALQGDAPQAKDLTVTLLEADPQYLPMLCRLWLDFPEEKTFRTGLGCP